MDPTRTSDNTPGRAETRMTGVHAETPTIPVSTPVIKEVIQEEIAAESPDGRPPSWGDRLKGRGALIAVLLILLPGVITGIVYWGGGAALLMGGVYLVVMALVSTPIWAGVLRRKEEKEAEAQVRRDRGEATVP